VRNSFSVAISFCHSNPVSLSEHSQIASVSLFFSSPCSCSLSHLAVLLLFPLAFSVPSFLPSSGLSFFLSFFLFCSLFVTLICHDLCDWSCSCSECFPLLDFQVLLRQRARRTEQMAAEVLTRVPLNAIAGSSFRATTAEPPCIQRVALSERGAREDEGGDEAGAETAWIRACLEFIIQSHHHTWYG